MTGRRHEPFPGPRPYDEDRHHLFFGRELEVERMINATRERLAVLSAESGAGKSSLLAAGYVPHLRKLRASKRGEPPVLLLRSWSGRASDAENRIRDGIVDGVRQLEQRAALWAAQAATVADDGTKRRSAAIAASIADDHRKLTEILGRFDLRAKGDASRLTEILQALSDDEGLILILDQFEEFMGSASSEAGGDHRPAERATQAVGRLFRDVPKLRILIALRTEYCRTLQRDLNFFVPNLDRRIIDLSPLRSKSLAQIVKGVAADDTPDEDVDDFAHRLALASGATEGDESSNVSVLEVQALLHGYHAWTSIEKDAPDFTLRWWDEYVDTLTLGASDPLAHVAPALSARQGGSPAVGRQALRRWVASQLDLAVGDPAADGGQLARWLLLPVLPRLSTQGGYKQHLPLLQLCLDLADRLADGWGHFDSVRQSVEAWLERGGTSPLVFADMDLRELRQLKAEWSNKTAAGRAQAVSTIQADIAECVTAFRATVTALQHQGIVKVSGSGRDESCELVHDGLSEHVRAWAGQLPTRPETMLGAPVDVVGERFAWRELGGDRPCTVSGKVWIGCAVRGARITNVRFEGCTFRGLSFSDCILEDVVFDRCVMPGAIFIDCTLVGVAFTACTLSSAGFIKCTFGELTQYSGSLPVLSGGATLDRNEKKDICDLTGIDFEGCTLLVRSQMKFTECLLRFARIRDIDNSGGNRWEFSKCDLMNAWVEDAGTPSVEVDQHCRTLGFLSFELPPVGWLERRKS